MILVVVVILAVATVPLARGNLSALLDLRMQAVWLLGLAFAIQLGLALVPGESSGLRLLAHATSYPIGLAFVWVNRRIPGMLVIGLGALLNGVAVVANGGVMPTTVSALETAGLDVDPETFANSAALADPRLPFLGDVFAIPASFPFANVFSVGDVLIAVGAAYAVHAACGSHLVPERLRVATGAART